MLLQARERRPEESASGIRIGYTCSKKIGNAVFRNRAKRRLRSLAREVIPQLGRDGWDYVLVGKPGVTVGADFARMRADLERAMRSIHSSGGSGRRPDPNKGPSMGATADDKPGDRQ